MGEVLQSLPFKPFIKELEEGGLYEVIQQGNDPVVGFANGDPCKDYKDVVIFGDHTLSVYKPKNPFFVATDGVRIVRGRDNSNGNYLFSLLEKYKPQSEGYKRYYTILVEMNCFDTVNSEEQIKIGHYFSHLDHLLSLHQRKPERSKHMQQNERNELFHIYYKRWIRVYKEGAIRKVTLSKYYMTYQWLMKISPTLRISDLTRISYQEILNEYAKYHERQTTMDFHHQLKGAILDAVDEGLIERDPTRKAIIKGKIPQEKKPKYLNQFELQVLLSNLNLSSQISWDWFILLIAKTGIRFSEALALTPRDFDLSHQILSINKTWNYKEDGGFLPTKNQSSIRKVQLDWQTVMQFAGLIKGLPVDLPIFIPQKGKIYNSTVNNVLYRLCQKSNVPSITIHGLRHTHASILLFAGVSIASVARRLGHSSMTTTQKTYLHIIQELENQDIDLIMRSLSRLN